MVCHSWRFHDLSKQITFAHQLQLTVTSDKLFRSLPVLNRASSRAHLVNHGENHPRAATVYAYQIMQHQTIITDKTLCGSRQRPAARAIFT